MKISEVVNQKEMHQVSTLIASNLLVKVEHGAWLVQDEQEEKVKLRCQSQPIQVYFLTCFWYHWFCMFYHIDAQGL